MDRTNAALLEHSKVMSYEQTRVEGEEKGVGLVPSMAFSNFKIKGRGRERRIRSEQEGSSTFWYPAWRPLIRR